MKPLNTAARKKTFINFLIFFSVTALVILTTVFFSVQVPLKQNEQLRERVAIAQSQQFFSALFTSKMTETIKLLDSVNMNEVQTQSERFDAAISSNLIDMNAMALRDSSADKTLYQGIANSLALLQRAKKNLRDASGKDNNLSDQSKKIESLTNDLRDAQTQLQICKLANQQQQH